MKAKSIAVLLGLFSCALPCASQLVEVTIEPYVVHDGSIAELAGMTTYHVYAVCQNETDELSAVYGDASAPLSITSTDGFYQNLLGSNVAWTINPAFFGAFPAIEYDSWVALGAMNQNEVTGQPNTVGMDGAFATFAAGGNLVVNSENGGSWFTLFGDTQAQAGDDLKVLIAQLTVTNEAVITGNFNIQIFVNGEMSASQQFEGIPFSSNAGAIFGCMDPNALNYNPEATESGETCIYPCALELAVSTITPPSCPGLADGEIHVASTGGQLGVLYGMVQGPSSLAVGVFDELLGGVYTVTALDGAGCEATIEVELVDPDPIIISASITEGVSCNGDSDAVISGSSTGGTGAITYSLSPTFANSSSELNFGDLGPGLYTVYAQDENGCTAASSPISIANPQQLNVFVSGGQNGILDATCSDSEDGSVVLITIGGSGTAAEMSFGTDGVNFAPGNILYLNPGTYTFYAMDVNGCVAATVNEYVVNGPPPIEWAIETYDAECPGENGVVYVSAEGGNGGWSFGLNGTSYDGAFETFIPAGEYEVVATDSEDCGASTVFSVEEPAPIEWSIEVLEEPSCSNGFIGSTELEVTGGVPPYLWTDGQADAEFGSTFLWNMATGVQVFTLWDANGCSTEGTYDLVGAPSFVGFTPVINEPTCQGYSDATLSPDPAFDYTAWNVSWTGPLSGEQSPFEAIEGLVAGAYSLSLSSDEYTDCEATIDIVIEEPLAVEVQLESASPLCADEQSGIIQASVENATGSVQWTVNGVSVSEQNELLLFGLSPGTFAVQAMDALGCTGESSAILVNPEPLNEWPSTVVQPTTYANGSISLDVPSDFSVSWLANDGTDLGTGTALSNLEAGVYTASLEDPNGCTGEQSFELAFAGCGLVDAQDWPNNAAGLFPEGEEVWNLGVELASEWVLRIPEVVNDEGVNFAVSHFELEVISNLPVGTTADVEVGAEPGADEALCIPMAGTPVEPGTYEVAVSGTLYLVIFGTQFPIPSFTFTKTVLVESSAEPILGCAYEWASNYNAFATHDDGSCELAGGCTYEVAENYDPQAGLDDGTCVFMFEPEMDSCYFDFDNNGEVGATDLLTFLSAYASECP